MSQFMVLVLSQLLSFPRVSGDEPAASASCASFTRFSPRERG